MEQVAFGFKFTFGACVALILFCIVGIGVITFIRYKKEKEVFHRKGLGHGTQKSKDSIGKGA